MSDTALVTGASAGIGEEFAKQLSARGYEVILVARRAERLEQLGLQVDLLVNNAGFGTHGRFAEIDPARDAELVRVNCEAVITLTHAFLPGMLERRRGGVITVASTAGMQPIPYEATYGASKAFAISFMEALWMELRGTGVK